MNLNLFALTLRKYGSGFAKLAKSLLTIIYKAQHYTS